MPSVTDISFKRQHLVCHEALVKMDYVSMNIKWPCSQTSILS